jgi:hypothetical protein
MSQTIPQPPQFAESLSVWRHAPSQNMPNGHAHAPPLHLLVGAAQVSLQPPQFAGSLSTSVQTPSQRTPEGHTHSPSTHTSPAVHATSQLPQCVPSVFRSKQPSAQ